MHEPSSMQRLMREWIVVRYTTALERGDLDTLSAIMERAQNDTILQLMILEIHELYDRENLLFLMKDEDIEMETKTGTARSIPEGDPHERPDRPHRRALWVNALAAAVLICVLGGGFLGIHYWSSSQTAHPGASATPTTTTVGHNGWCVVSSPALPPEDLNPQLSAISGDAPNDIWAVGSTVNHSQGQRSLLEHWNGHAWAIVPLPNTNAAWDELSGVQAIAPNDVWAVGNTSGAIQPSPVGWSGSGIEPYAALSGGPGSGSDEILLEHWNGQQWSIVSSPHPATWGTASLSSISAVSANDIWAIGVFEDRTGLANDPKTSGTYKPLVEHWDGTQWNIISSSAFPQGVSFNLVKALSANDIWFASERSSETAGTAPQTPLLHWNGNQWQVIQALGYSLNSFSAVSTNDIWAVGSNGQKAMAAHWNGAQWSIVTTPDANPKQAPGAQVSLTGIFAVSTNNVWAVGSASDSQGQIAYQVVEHWDGQQWKVLPSDRQEDPGQLLSVTVIGGKVWSVGVGYTDSYQEIPTTLIETSCR